MKVDKISSDIKELEKELLELKPLLDQLDDQQLKFAAKQLSVRGGSLLSIITMLT
ncbi:hypothetical protein LAV79_07615 [Peribacillus butanolivorans]|uniref:hypothetical protein n=1 Tax=Peribacillus butanolivorans TaxID=421767 RepID=UPI0030C99C49